MKRGHVLLAAVSSTMAIFPNAHGQQHPPELGVSGAQTVVARCEDTQQRHQQSVVIEACTALIDLFSTPATGTRLQTPEDREQLAQSFAFRAMAWTRFGNLDQAQSDYDAALELLPNRPSLLRHRCIFHIITNRDVNRGMADCVRWQSQNPRSSEALAWEGFARLRRGEFEVASGRFDAALALAEDNFGALYGRGLARAKMGSVQDGERDIATALERDEASVLALQRRGFTP